MKNLFHSFQLKEKQTPRFVFLSEVLGGRDSILDLSNFKIDEKEINKASEQKALNDGEKQAKALIKGKETAKKVEAIKQVEAKTKALNGNNIEKEVDAALEAALAKEVSEKTDTTNAKPSEEKTLTDNIKTVTEGLENQDFFKAIKDFFKKLGDLFNFKKKEILSTENQKKSEKRSSKELKEDLKTKNTTIDETYTKLRLIEDDEYNPQTEEGQKLDVTLQKLIKEKETIEEQIKKTEEKEETEEQKQVREKNEKAEKLFENKILNKFVKLEQNKFQTIQWENPSLFHLDASGRPIVVLNYIAGNNGTPFVSEKELKEAKITASDLVKYLKENKATIKEKVTKNTKKV